MRRRAILALAAIAAWPAAGRGQQKAKIPRVGLLATAGSVASPTNQAFLHGMRELGYAEGVNVAYEWRFADGVYERFPAFARELVQLNVDVIVLWGTPAIPAAQSATRTIPLVMATSTDPVENGFVANLARPGGNTTGLSNISAELGGKHLEMLAQIVPKLRRVAVLMDPRVISHPLVLKNVESAAERISVRVFPVRASKPEELEGAFATIRKERADAVITGLSGFFVFQGKTIAELALRQRLPTIFPSSGSVDAGGLMSYGQDLNDSFRRAAQYVDKILKGARPGELAIEQAAKIELVINLRTAKALGVAIPQSMQLRADRLVE